MPNRFDVKIDGTAYRLVRGEGSYQQGGNRAMVDIQEISTMKGSQLSSRGDVRAMFQTSWSGGSRWEKPVLDADSIDSYYTSDDFDMLVEPGSLLPRANTSASSTSPEEGHSKWVQTDYGTAYAVGEDGVTYHKIIKWSNGVVSTDATAHSNVANAETPVDMCWSETDGTLYILSTAGVEYVVPGSSQGNVTTSITGSNGSAIFMHDGILHVYDRNKVYKIADPKGTPVITDIFNDGYGADWLKNVAVSSSQLFYAWSMNLAISTTDGIYMAKNVTQAGTVIAYIYRIDKDASGTVIGTPVATLDPGYVALDIYWSLGSLIVSATSDIGLLGTNDVTVGIPRTEFFHLTQNSLGAIGAPTGNEPTEFVFKMLFTSQRSIYIGGHKNVWAYDPIRGGLHMLHEETSLTDGHFHSGIISKSGLHVFYGNGSAGQTAVTLTNSKATTTATSADIESNYFNFSLPGELKYVTDVTIMPTTIQAGETWTVYLEADDGSFQNVASFTSSGTQKASFTAPVSGYRFRYRVTYATTSTQSTPSKLKGIMFGALSGEMTPFWQLLIDGSEAVNVENQVVRPEKVFDDLKALRAKQSAVTFIDNYESDDRSDTATYTVRVHSVAIAKEEPKESQISVVLVGV